jgi:hypothetical protein
VDEGRKRVLLIAASILAARKLAQYDSGARVPDTVSAIADSIRWEILRRIEQRCDEERDRISEDGQRQRGGLNEVEEVGF